MKSFHERMLSIFVEGAAHRIFLEGALPPSHQRVPHRYTLKARCGMQTALARKDRGRDFASLEAAAVAERATVSSGMVDIKANSRDKFHIIVDGTVFGPLSRVRIGPTRCSLPRPTISVMTFHPTDV